MFGPSEDPLYRSDSRTVGSGSQQADLAPVSDQPSEHWEQQAAQREAAEPAAPTDPLGAQPQADAGEPEVPATPASESGSTQQPTAQPEPTPSPSTAGPGPAAASEPAGPTDSSGHDEAGQATFGHDATLTLGGEMAWSDLAGDHVRSGEATIDLSQVAAVGEATSAASDSIGGVSPAGTVSDVAQGALAQASALTQGGLASVQDGALTDVIDEITALPSALDAGALLGLDGVTSAVDEVGGLADGLLDGGLSEITDGLGVFALDALPDLDGGLPTDAIAAPSGLLAALFTPEAGEPADLLGGGVTETALEDAAPDLHLTDLAGGLDDHPDLGLGL